MIAMMIAIKTSMMTATMIGEMIAMTATVVVVAMHLQEGAWTWSWSAPHFTLG
jgi:hypothetical protein